MHKILLLGSSREGHTTKILSYLQRQISIYFLEEVQKQFAQTNKDFTEEMHNLPGAFTPSAIPQISFDYAPVNKALEGQLNDGSPLDLESYDAIVLGSSIHYGHFPKTLEQFALKHVKTLNQKASFFFGVNLTARKADKNTPETNTYVRKYLQQSPWTPSYTAVFAGALNYSQLSFFDRHIVRFIMKITKGDTDFSTNKVYTNWNDVNLLAHYVVSSVLYPDFLAELKAKTAKSCELLTLKSVQVRASTSKNE